MIQSVAFIGLGAMGYRMAAHLPKHFDTVYVWNRNFEKAKQHAAEYGTQAVELKQAVQADIIFSCLPTSKEVEEYEATFEVIELKEGVVFDVAPGYVHRVIATTDLEFTETSTTELDDVIRLQDDQGRTHGRISYEHESK